MANRSDRHLSNLSNCQGAKPVRLIRRRCADFHHGPERNAALQQQAGYMTAIAHQAIGAATLRTGLDPYMSVRIPSAPTNQSLDYRTIQRIERNPRVCARFAFTCGPGLGDRRRGRKSAKSRESSPRAIPCVRPHERAVVLETFCGETTALPPHQTLHLKQSLPIPFAFPFVSAKGEATGSEGSDRKRIRSASSHPGSIGGATPRVSKSQIAPINRVA